MTTTTTSPTSPRCCKLMRWMYIAVGLAILLNAFLALQLDEDHGQYQPATPSKHRREPKPSRRRHRLPKDAPCVSAECIAQEAASLARAFADRSNQTWQQLPGSNSTSAKKEHHGLLFVKVPKTGSSTAAAVALRIARNHGVSVRYDHSSPLEDHYENRHPTHSFLWTSIRNPAERAVSYLSYQASRKRQTFTTTTTTGDDGLVVLQQLRSMDRSGVVVKSEGRGGPQLAFTSLRFIPKHSAWTPSFPTYVANAKRVKEHVRHVLQNYDFLLVTERMDESLVALALTLGIDVADVLVVSSKVASRSFLPIHDDSTNGTLLCVPLIRLNVDTPAVQAYLTSDEWHAMNYGDYLLHAAASQSLNLTIQALGRDIFNRALAEYRRLHSQAMQQCVGRVHGPCSASGELQLQRASENCYQGDLGCGYQCIDEMLVEEEKRTD
jgi:hypothetical protein